MKFIKSILMVLNLFLISYPNCPIDSLQISNKILNNWEFISYSGTIAGGTYYPDFKYILKFELDSNKLVFKECRDDTLFNTDYVYLRKDIFSTDSCWVISGNFKYLEYLSSRWKYSIYFVGDSIMSLCASPTIPDGISLRFETIKASSIIRKNIVFPSSNQFGKVTYFNLSGQQISSFGKHLPNGVYIKSIKINNSYIVNKGILKNP